ncbi:MAG TPA: AraC family transcriptional regulator [Cyclobacteriaceae bacterium]|nr:AraC family transcriptional regulator [Cyclobacteriaceae bacterium]
MGSIHYQDMLEALEYNPSDNVDRKGEFISLNYNHRFWGRISERRLDRPEYSISHFRTDLNDDFAVAFNNERLENSVNICLSLDGYTGIRFKKNSLELALTTRKQHSLYIPENEYNVLVKKSMDNVHFAIDINYYLDLLSSMEDWSAPIRKLLEKRAIMYGGEFNVTPAMMQVVADILYNPLSGGLRALMVDAKVLELITLQLDSVADGKNKINKPATKDRELFFSIRNHLDKTFMEDHSLKGLGKTFAINEFKLKSGFKRIFEKTVFEYIHDRRMDHAFQLLHDHGLLVNEVSGRVGYKNPNHFSTAFKKKFGITPGKI